MKQHDLRRLFPPRRRRPGALTVLVRWRLELLGLAVAAVSWWLLGGVALGLICGWLVALAAVNGPVRRFLARGVLAVVVPHRVRAGLLQAGVTDRAGRLPWITRSRAHGELVYLRVWLRAGTTVGDVRAAVLVLRSACGAADVEIAHPPGRPDRVTIIVCRPRWSLPARG